MYNIIFYFIFPLLVLFNWTSACSFKCEGYYFYTVDSNGRHRGSITSELATFYQNTESATSYKYITITLNISCHVVGTYYPTYGSQQDVDGDYDAGTVFRMESQNMSGNWYINANSMLLFY